MTIFRRLRDPVSGLMHLGAAVAAAFGLVFLLAINREGTRIGIALTIYGASLVSVFACSAAYHLIKAHPRVIQRLRILDHTAIYLLIAGTYTPICLQFFSGFWGTGFLGIIWLLALAGIISKIFIVDAPRWLTAGIYLLMGWLSIFAIGEMLRAMPAGALLWIVIGGFFFTLGAVGYITKKPDFFPGVFGFHEVWHIMVILGALSHFIAVAAYVARPGAPF